MRKPARRRGVAAAAVMAVTTVGLAACSGGGGAEEASCTNKIKQPEATQVTVWAWYPSFESIVDNFNDTHTDIQVCWTNAGQGADEYNKFQTAIEADTGAPDVIMLEAEVLPTFTILDSLVDLSAYGAGELKDDYTEGSWADVSNGDAVYAIPVDGGPMGMLYRADIFKKYGVDVPTTWDEFAKAAQDLRDAGFKGSITDFPTNGNALNYALFAQNGWKPFQYDPAKPTEVGINVDTPEAEEVLSYWKGLIDDDLVATEDAFTTDYNAALVDGTYAVYLAAAWGPGYLQGLSESDSDAEWRAAPMPQWDPKNPVQVNWGGSTFAVTKQSEQPEAAATVAKELFDTDEAWQLGVKEAALWPQYKPTLEADWFTGLKAPFFGGQKINEDVFLDAAAGYKGFSFSPFQVYAYDQQTQALYDMVQKDTDPGAALSTIQDGLVKYATEQGFTVSQ
ncbi:ABC transporter substrate-binding protein [Promicromonospora sp. NPDC057138]|uniref:ABC transporter substrate-binding protein n=1 Tax=Promicromonospora sp. NPDC057138 TaxID=3346031 RepID=UPI0036310519